MFVSWLLAFCFGAIFSGNRMQTASLQLVNHPLSEVYKWKYFDYLYDSEAQRQEILKNGNYIAEANVPIDVDLSPDGRTFVTVIRYQGVPSSLNVVSSKNGEGGPLLKPYPDWSWTKTDCTGIVSVFRVYISRNTLYVLDNGKIGDNKVCSAQLLVFDLMNDKLIQKLTIPDQIATNTTSGRGLLITPVIIPYDHPVPFDAILADVEGYALVTYNPQTHWNRVTSSALDYDPNHVTYTINGQSFQLTDGPLGMALSPLTGKLYLSPMSTFNLVSVNSYELIHARNNNVQFTVYKDILPTQSSAKAMSLSGILFFALPGRTSIACWNERLPLIKDNLVEIAQSSELLQFASGMKVKRNSSGSSWFTPNENLWMLTNRFQKVATGTLNTNEVNFRILVANVVQLTKGTLCQQDRF